MTEISWSRHASTIFSSRPFFFARRALWSTCVEGPKRYLKKSKRVGFSGMRGSRGSSPIM